MQTEIKHLARILDKFEEKKESFLLYRNISLV